MQRETAHTPRPVPHAHLHGLQIVRNKLRNLGLPVDVRDDLQVHIGGHEGLSNLRLRDLRILVRLRCQSGPDTGKQPRCDENALTTNMCAAMVQISALCQVMVPTYHGACSHALAGVFQRACQRVLAHTAPRLSALFGEAPDFTARCNGRLIVKVPASGETSGLASDKQHRWSA